jgi:flagellar basal-body rod protein FlgC
VNLLSAIDISASGLTAQRMRIQVLVSNLVNANTTDVEGAGPYRRRDVVFRAKALEPSFGEAFNEAMIESRGVEVERVVRATSEPVRRYEPKHPHADKDGYVAYPNINPVEELVNMMTATRSYEANLKVVESVKDMAYKTLEILR